MCLRRVDRFRNYVHTWLRYWVHQHDSCEGNHRDYPIPMDTYSHLCYNNVSLSVHFSSDNLLIASQDNILYSRKQFAVHPHSKNVVGNRVMANSSFLSIPCELEEKSLLFNIHIICVNWMNVARCVCLSESELSSANSCCILLKLCNVVRVLFICIQRTEWKLDSNSMYE